ncbi:MAG: hypothetical protein ABIT09_10825 [Croceibacterium sp.]
MSQPLPLQARVEAASRMAFKSRQFYSLYFATKGEAGHRLHHGAINEYYEVIRFFEAACRDAALIELHSLFTPRKDTVNLPRLVQEMEGTVGPLNKSRQALRAIATNLPKIKHLRDKALAHRTKLIEFNDVFREADITHVQVSSAIDAAVVIANELRFACGLSQEPVSPAPVETYYEMLEALRPST